MGVESYLVLWVFTDEGCHPNRFRVELMLIESFEIGRLDFPNRDTLKSTHCFCLTRIRLHPTIYISASIEGSLPENTVGRQPQFRAKQAPGNFRQKKYMSDKIGCR